MNYCLNLQLLVLFHLVIPGLSWQFFTSLSNVNLYETALDDEHLHSEYGFGHCYRKGMYALLAHIHKNHLEVLGKIIIRGWLDIKRMPTCIVLRANAYEEDMFRSTSYNFQMCVPRITYCHSRFRFKYFYYEWYIPTEMIGGMNWDLYFFGPEDLTWQ